MSVNQQSYPTRGVAVVAPYGAFELKRNYQKNMFLGSISSAFLAAICIFSIWFFGLSTYEEITGSRGSDLDSIVSRPIRLPKIIPRPPQVNPSRPGGAPHKYGIFKLVDDDEFFEDIVSTYARGDFMGLDSGSDSPEGYEDGEPGIPYNSEYLPSPDKFVSVEVQPIQIYEEKPKYPRLALDGGFSAYVIVETFVSRTGVVLKAQAKKCSRPGMGFEEKAIAAALKCKYRPAIQNGDPIGIWISYRVSFEIGN